MWNMLKNNQVEILYLGLSFKLCNIVLPLEISVILNPLYHNSVFNPQRKKFWKHGGKKEKMVEINIASFLTVFYLCTVEDISNCIQYAQLSLQ